MANQTDEQEAETESLELLASEEDALELLREKGSPRLQEQLEHGVVTPIELANAVGKRPQMIYNYIRAGRIAAHRNDETQKLRGDPDDQVRAAKWRGATTPLLLHFGDFIRGLKTQLVHRLVLFSPLMKSQELGPTLIECTS
jgi:hypothetical protein